MSKIKLRRFKNKLSNIKAHVIIGFSLLFLLTIGSGYAIMSTHGTITGGATILAPTYECFLNIETNATLRTSWSGDNKHFYTYNFTVNNLDNDSINGWELIVKGPKDLDVNYGNVKYTRRFDGALIITNESYNGRINGNGTFSVEVSFSTVETTLTLTEMYFNGCSMVETEPLPDDDNVELTALSIIPSTYSMLPEEEAPLQLELTPENATSTYKWTSSNTSIVKVSTTGLVKAIKPGTATITVTSANGLTSTCEITVESPPTEPIDPDDPNAKIPMTEITVDFKNTYSYNNTFFFEFELTNNTEVNLTNFSFELDLPEGTEYSFWQNTGATADGNTFNFQIPTWKTFAPNETIKITGSITLPDGYYGSDITEIKFVNFKNN